MRIEGLLGSSYAGHSDAAGPVSIPDLRWLVDPEPEMHGETVSLRSSQRSRWVSPRLEGAAVPSSGDCPEERKTLTCGGLLSTGPEPVLTPTHLRTITAGHMGPLTCVGNNHASFCTPQRSPMGEPHRLVPTSDTRMMQGVTSLFPG